MTKDETLLLLAKLKVAYPQQVRDMDKDIALEMVELWYEEFGNLPYDVMYLAVRSIVRRLKFFPSIAEMCDELDQLNKEAYCKLTCGKYTEEKSQLDYDAEMDLAYIEECRSRMEANREIPEFFKSEFCEEWRKTNIKPPIRNYSEEVEKQLELIRKVTSSFAKTKQIEHRQKGARDFLLDNIKTGLLQIKGDNNE